MEQKHCELVAYPDNLPEEQQVQPFRFVTHKKSVNDVDRWFGVYETKLYEFDRFEIKTVAIIPDCQNPNVPERLAVFEDQLYVSNGTSLLRVKFADDYEESKSVEWETVLGGKEDLLLF